MWLWCTFPHTKEREHANFTYMHTLFLILHETVDCDVLLCNFGCWTGEYTYSPKYLPYRVFFFAGPEERTAEVILRPTTTMGPYKVSLTAIDVMKQQLNKLKQHYEHKEKSLSQRIQGESHILMPWWDDDSVRTMQLDRTWTCDLVAVRQQTTEPSSGIL